VSGRRATRASAPLLALLALGGCAAQDGASPRGEAAPRSQAGGEADVATTRATPWELRLSDGNGNGYRLWQEEPGAGARFEYLPVTTAQSSSGLYSGGAPREGSVAPAEAEALWDRVETFAADPALQADARRKGTGAVRWTTPAGERSFLLERGPELDDLVERLARLGR
jgi:hypothetical protein